MLKNNFINFVKFMLSKTPYRVVRDRGANRFEATEIALRGMKSRGFIPDIIIDGGAHLGWFSLMAEKIFPEAQFCLIEPQLSCLTELRALCHAKGWALHECALGEAPGRISFSKTSSPNTGAHVRSSSDPDTIFVPVKTIDDILNFSSMPRRGALLKLDIQGYELFSLRGAKHTLTHIDAVLLEASLYAQNYEPSMFSIFQFFEEHEFELYDVAALSGRTRDNRLRQCDLIFARKGINITADKSWA